jgi:hypothetical protein
VFTSLPVHFRFENYIKGKALDLYLQASAVALQAKDAEIRRLQVVGVSACLVWLEACVGLFVLISSPVALLVSLWGMTSSKATLQATLQGMKSSGQKSPTSRRYYWCKGRRVQCPAGTLAEESKG